MQTLLADFVAREAVIAASWGSFGGLAAWIVLGTHMKEVLGRVIVGAIVAATVAPYAIASTLNIDATDPVYPLVCCALGLIGHQVVQMAALHPENIPIIRNISSALRSGPVSGKSAPSVPLPPNRLNPPVVADPGPSSGQKISAPRIE